MSRLEGKKHWLTGSPNRRDTEAKPRKNNYGGFFGLKEVGVLFPKARSVIELFERVWGSTGTLLTPGQGRQGLKIPKMSRK